LAFALAIAAATAVQAVPGQSDPSHDVTIYRQLGYAFGFSNSTPSGLFGAFGGGGGGGGGGGFAGGTVPQLNLGPAAGGNFLGAPGGGGGGGGGGGYGGIISSPSPILLPGAPVVGGGGQGGGSPSPQIDIVQVPDAGVSTLGFGLTLALFALAARRPSIFRRAAADSRS